MPDPGKAARASQELKSQSKRQQREEEGRRWWVVVRLARLASQEEDEGGDERRHTHKVRALLIFGRRKRGRRRGASGTMMERDRWEEDEEGEEIEWRRRVRSSRGPNASKQGRVQTTNDAMRRGEWKQNRELLSWRGAIDERSVCQNQASLEAEQGAGAVDLRSVFDSLHAGPTRGTLGPLSVSFALP